MHLEIVPKDTTLDAARVQFSILRKIGMEERARCNSTQVSAFIKAQN